MATASAVSLIFIPRFADGLPVVIGLAKYGRARRNPKLHFHLALTRDKQLTIGDK
jgi:hypothetical protein